MTSVFIVEDDKSIQMLYQKILKLVGFHIIGIANNGEEAIAMFREFNDKPEIIIMDHRMPVKNGIEATKEEREMLVKFKNSEPVDIEDSNITEWNGIPVEIVD